MTLHHLVPVQAGGTDHPCNLRKVPTVLEKVWHELFGHRQTIQVFRLLLDIWRIDGQSVEQITVHHDGRELVLRSRSPRLGNPQSIKRQALKRLFGCRSPVETLQHILDEWAPVGVFARCLVSTSNQVVDLNVHPVVGYPPGRGHPALIRPMTDRRPLMNVRQRLDEIRRSARHQKSNC